MNPARARPGFALLASLWLIVALTAIAGSVGLRSRLARLRAANVIELSRAEAAAFGALEQARSKLQLTLDRQQVTASTDPWAYIESADTTVLSGVSYTISYQDLGAQLHLNRASEEELRQLLRALRIDWGEADKLAQAIADWRDADDFPRGRGAEREQYLTAKRATLPANRPFAAVSELRNVLGISEAHMQRLQPLLTVEGSGQININRAPREVLLALPGFSEDPVEAILGQQALQREIRSLDEIANILSPAARERLRAAAPELQARVVFAARELEVTANAWLEGSPVRVTAHGLFARGGNTAFFVKRSIE